MADIFTKTSGFSVSIDDETDQEPLCSADGGTDTVASYSSNCDGRNLLAFAENLISKSKERVHNPTQSLQLLSCGIEALDLKRKRASLNFSEILYVVLFLQYWFVGVLYDLELQFDYGKEFVYQRKPPEENEFITSCECCDADGDNTSNKGNDVKNTSTSTTMTSTKTKPQTTRQLFKSNSNGDDGDDDDDDQKSRKKFKNNKCNGSYPDLDDDDGDDDDDDESGFDDGDCNGEDENGNRGLEDWEATASMKEEISTTRNTTAETKDQQEVVNVIGEEQHGINNTQSASKEQGQVNGISDIPCMSKEQEVNGVNDMPSASKEQEEVKESEDNSTLDHHVPAILSNVSFGSSIHCNGVNYGSQEFEESLRQPSNISAAPESVNNLPQQTQMLLEAFRCNTETHGNIERCRMSPCYQIHLLLQHSRECKYRVLGGCKKCINLRDLYLCHTDSHNDNVRCVIPRCREIKEHHRKEGRRLFLNWKYQDDNIFFGDSFVQHQNDIKELLSQLSSCIENDDRITSQSMQITDDEVTEFIHQISLGGHDRGQQLDPVPRGSQDTPAIERESDTVQSFSTVPRVSQGIPDIVRESDIVQSVGTVPRGSQDIPAIERKSDVVQSFSTVPRGSQSIPDIERESDTVQSFSTVPRGSQDTPAIARESDVVQSFSTVPRGSQSIPDIERESDTVQSLSTVPRGRQDTPDIARESDTVQSFSTVPRGSQGIPVVETHITIPRPDMVSVLHPYDKDHLSVQNGCYDEGFEWMKVQEDRAYLGQGTFGKVYLNTDLKTGKLFATKKIPLSKYQPNELSVWSSVSGSCVRCVDLYGAVEVGQFVNIFMEYMEGGSVAQILCHLENQCLDENSSLFILREVLEALHFLHSRNILHRDVKGENVFVNTTLTRVKLGDYGTAVQMSSMNCIHLDRTLSGTEYFMAPEVCRNEALSFSMDIWSSGCFMIQMLTGEPPFYRFGGSIIYKVGTLTGPPPIPCGCNDNVKAMLRHMFALEPSERPSAQTLLGYSLLSEVNCPSQVTPSDEEGLQCRIDYDVSASLASHSGVSMNVDEELSSLQSEFLRNLTLDGTNVSDYIRSQPIEQESESSEDPLNEDFGELESFAFDNALRDTTRMSHSYSTKELTKVEFYNNSGELMFQVREKSSCKVCHLAESLHYLITEKDANLVCFSVQSANNTIVDVDQTIGHTSLSLYVIPAGDWSTNWSWRVNSHGHTEERSPME